MFDLLPAECSLSGRALSDEWSTYAPDGLLGDMLSVATGGTCADRLERIGGWEHIIAWAHAAQAREIAGLAAAAVTDPAHAGTPDEVEASVNAEVGLMCRLAPRTAAARVADAVALVTRLPAVLVALSDGRISSQSARAISEESAALPREFLADLQERVLAKAGSQTPSQVRASTRRAVAHLDAEAVRRRAEQARTERHVRVTPEADGMATVSAYLPAADAVGIYGVLDECARRTGGTGDARSIDARRADALVDLVLDRLSRPTADPGSCAREPRERPDAAERSHADEPPDDRRIRDRADVQIRVTVSLTTLLGLHQLPAELAGYGPIPADTARELAAHGTWRRLVTDPLSGQPLDYGVTRYRPPPHLAEHVIARDQTCDFPSCRIPAHRCDLDHRVPFDPVTGTGETSAENLGARCRTHHRLKSSPGWYLTRDREGVIVWRSPTGHSFPSTPDDTGPPNSTEDPSSRDDPPPF